VQCGAVCAPGSFVNYIYTAQPTCYELSKKLGIITRPFNSTPEIIHALHYVLAVDKQISQTTTIMRVGNIHKRCCKVTSIIVSIKLSILREDSTIEPASYIQMALVRASMTAAAFGDTKYCSRAAFKGSVDSCWS